MNYYYDSSWESEISSDCVNCQETKKLLHDMADQFMGVLEHLQGEGSLDESMLKFNLEELCYYLGIEWKNKPLTVKRKPKRLEPFLEEMIDLNTKLLKSQLLNSIR